MSDFRVVMQAKKRLFWMPLDDTDGPPMPFRLKGDLLVMVGARTTRSGYHPIEYNDENFRFFVPIDMLKLNLGDSHEPTQTPK